MTESAALHRRRIFTVRTLVLSVLSTCVVTGCGLLRRDDTESEAIAAVDSSVPEDRLQQTLFAFCDRLSVQIQAAANQIADESADPLIGRRTVMWKLFAVPYARETVYGQHPNAALVDLWVFCIQMQDYFDSGDGQDAFGTHTPIALESSGMLASEIAELARMALQPSRFAEAEKSVEQFARSHPIFGSVQGTMAIRASSSEPSADKTLQWVLDVSLTPFRAIGGMDETAQAIHEVAGVAESASAVVRHLPEQVRWNTELLLYDLESRRTVSTAVESIDSLAKSAARITETAEKLPKEIRREVTGVLDELESKQGELQKTLAETRQTLAAADTTLALAETTSKHLAEAGTEWQGTFRSITQMVRDLSGDPEEKKPDKGAETDTEAEPFDIKDYARTAEGIASAARELRSAMDEMRGLAGSKEVDDTVDKTAERFESLANHVAMLGAALIVVFFSGAWIYRTTTRSSPRKARANVSKRGKESV